MQICKAWQNNALAPGNAEGSGGELNMPHFSSLCLFCRFFLCGFGADLRTKRNTIIKISSSFHKSAFCLVLFTFIKCNANVRLQNGLQYGPAPERCLAPFWHSWPKGLSRPQLNCFIGREIWESKLKGRSNSVIKNQLGDRIARVLNPLRSPQQIFFWGRSSWVTAACEWSLRWSEF